MNKLTYLCRTFTKNRKEVETRIYLSLQSKAEGVFDFWIDDDDVLETIPISKRKLQSLRKDGTLPNRFIKGKFYYKFSGVMELLLSNYYNPNFKCDGVK